jgi:peptidoglycan/xylan/chitin deacetylase (PgdA/CDA1 family)
MNGRLLRWLMSLALPPVNGSDGGPRLTILRHHRVFENGARPLYRLGVSERVLAEQVAMLRGAGLGPVTVAEGLERLAEGRPGRWVAFSFDDGYADNVRRALPILRRAGGRATFYLTAGLIDERRVPWWDIMAHAIATSRRARLVWDIAGRRLDLPLGDERSRRAALAQVLPCFRVDPAEQARRLDALREMLGVTSHAECELATWDEAAQLAEAGMEVGAHTLDHPYLDHLPPAAQGAEITGSVERIHARLGLRPEGFAFPGGAYDAASVEACRRAGLAYAVTTRAGDNRARAPRFELSRRGFDEGMCLGPGGRFSRRLAAAELDGAFDRLRRARREAFA